jgi:hypothetical protein
VVRRKIPLSLTSVAVALGVFAVAPAANAQPSELFHCLFSHTDLPPCRDIHGSILFHNECGRAFVRYLSHVGWYPLRCVGPIEVAVETASSFYDQFPLYVEIVPLDGIDPTQVCENALGYVLLTLHPDRSSPESCDFWRSSGIVDISSIVPIGGTYALRLYGFHHPVSNSSAVDCVRVIAHPAPAAVARQSWGLVKCLYR